MKRLVLGAVAGAMLFPGLALAQPETKLGSHLDAKTRHVMWCSAVFYEESLWYEEDDAWSEYYALLGDELDWLSWEALEDAGLPEVEQDELWVLYDDAAMELAETDEDAFLALLESCEDDFGTLAERPAE